MSADQLTVPLMLNCALVGTITATMHIIGAAWYDLREAQKQRQLRKHPHARRYRQRPLVSIIVSTHDDERVIERCLASLAASSYRKVEIIIVDHASNDATKDIVKKYTAGHPKKNIRLVARRSAAGERSALARVYQRHGAGQLVMELRCTDMLDKSALSNAVKHFNMEQDLAVLNPANEVASAFSVAGLFQKYLTFLSQRPKKFASITGSEYLVEQAAIYRRDTFLDLYKATAKQRHGEAAGLSFGNKRVRTYYASDVIINTPPQVSLYRLLKHQYGLQQWRLQVLVADRRLFFAHAADYAKFLTWFRLPFAVCVGAAAAALPILLGYFMYLAFGLHEPTLLLVSAATLGIFLLFAIWDDGQLKLRQKLAYSAGFPMTYGLFYLLSFVQIFVVFGSILPRKKVRPS